MAREFFDPTPEKQNVRLIDSRTLHEAERLIESCEYCNPDGAEIPFDRIFDCTGIETGFDCGTVQEEVSIGNSM